MRGDNEPMPRLTLDLPELSFRRLQALAQRDRRDVRQQAAVIVEKATRRSSHVEGVAPSTPRKEPLHAVGV